jgi:hypothetical protein
VCCWYLGARPTRGAHARACARARARGPPRPDGVRQHEQSRKHFPIYTGPSKIYVGHQPRTTVDFRASPEERIGVSIYTGEGCHLGGIIGIPWSGSEAGFGVHVDFPFNI